MSCSITRRVLSPATTLGPDPNSPTRMSVAAVGDASQLAIDEPDEISGLRSK